MYIYNPLKYRTMKSVCDFIMKKQCVILDNYTFRMHYRVTTFVLLVFSIFLALGQVFGDPIDCSITEKGGLDSLTVNPDMLDTFCWVHSTFTYPTPAAPVKSSATIDISSSTSSSSINRTKIYDRTDHGAHTTHMDPDHLTVRYPGLLPPPSPAKTQPRYHQYYKWVALFLFMQALTFYFPRYLWKLWEGGKVKGLTDQLHPLQQQQQDTQVDNPVIIQKKRHLLEYFNKNLHKHHYYAFKFFFCEILNLINVITQIFITDKFLGYQFLTYGSLVVQFKDSPGSPAAGHRYDAQPHPMDEVFPKMTRCRMYTAASSAGPDPATGDLLKTTDALCVLQNNDYNDKIFLFLWFWFVILSLLSGISFIYRLATFSSSFRCKLLCSELRLVDPQAVKIVSRHCNIGDWFLLYILALNMDPDIYKEFFSDLVLKFAQKQPY